MAGIRLYLQYNLKRAPGPKLLPSGQRPSYHRQKHTSAEPWRGNPNTVYPLRTHPCCLRHAGPAERCGNLSLAISHLWQNADRRALCTAASALAQRPAPRPVPDAPYQRLAPSRRTGGGAQRSRRGAPSAPGRAPASRAGAASLPRAPGPSSPPGAAPRRLGGCQRSPPPPPAGRGAGGPGSSRRGGAAAGGASSRRPPPGRQRSAAGAARSPRGGSARQQHVPHQSSPGSLSRLPC